MNDIFFWYLMEGLSKRNKLKSLTGPELQKAFEILLKRGRTEDVKLLAKLNNTKPSETTIQRAYNELLKKSWTGGIERIQNETGVKPKFGKEETLKVIETLISQGATGQLTALLKVSGIKVPKKAAISGYEKLMKRGSVEKIEKIQKLVKVPWENKEYLFLKALQKGDFSNANDIFRSNRSAISRKYPGSSRLIEKYVI